MTYAFQSAIRALCRPALHSPAKRIMTQFQADRPPHTAFDAIRRSQGRVAEKLAQAAERLRRVESILCRPLEGNHIVEQIAKSNADGPAVDLARVATLRNEELESGEAPYLLLVDRAEASRSALAYLLRDQGYAVCEVGSANQLPADSDPSPALVIFDPGPFLSEALAAVSAMTSRSGWGTTPVLLLGSTAAGDERDRALAAGCVECLPKPCQPADLTAAVERIVGPPRCGVLARTTPRAAAAEV